MIRNLRGIAFLKMREYKMKKALILILTIAVCAGLLCLPAAAANLLQDENENGIADQIENALSNSPEISSLVDAANNGEISLESIGSAMMDALRGIEGIDVDRLLGGLEGLDEDDGLLGRLGSLIGPNINGLAVTWPDTGGDTMKEAIAKALDSQWLKNCLTVNWMSPGVNLNSPFSIFQSKFSLSIS